MTLIYESAPELDETITIDPDIEDLHYDRTVDRHKVHRAAVSEVFLTDIRRQSAQHVLVAAQLPSSHSFFHDSIYNDAEGTPDVLLLLEIARQATIASAHEVGVDAGNTLISNEFGLTIYPHEIAALNPEDTNLLIRNYFDWTSIRRGAPRSGRCYQQLITGNRVIADALQRRAHSHQKPIAGAAQRIPRHSAAHDPPNLHRADLHRRAGSHRPRAVWAGATPSTW